MPQNTPLHRGSNRQERHSNTKSPAPGPRAGDQPVATLPDSLLHGDNNLGELGNSSKSAYSMAGLWMPSFALYIEGGYMAPLCTVMKNSPDRDSMDKHKDWNSRARKKGSLQKSQTYQTHDGENLQNDRR